MVTGSGHLRDCFLVHSVCLSKSRCCRKGFTLALERLCSKNEKLTCSPLLLPAPFFNPRAEKYCGRGTLDNIG